MSGRKRQADALQVSGSDDDLPLLAPAITKKSKTSATLPRHLIAAELEALPSQELIGRIFELQETLEEIQSQLKTEKDRAKSLKTTNKQTTLGPTNGNAVAAQDWTAEKIAERADKLADMTTKGIKKQMKWQPSCKRGTSKWSHTGVAPNPQVFFKMLNLPGDSKPWKRKKFSVSDFEDAFGSIEASIRYGSLRITSQHVNLKWDPEVNGYTISGTY